MNTCQNLPMPVVLDADIIARIIDRITAQQEAEAQDDQLPPWLNNLVNEYEENFTRAQLDRDDMPEESPDAVWVDCPF